jgi:hypothetical protein
MMTMLKAASRAYCFLEKGHRQENRKRMKDKGKAASRRRPHPWHYSPTNGMKVFSDSNRDNRIYNEM